MRSDGREEMEELIVAGQSLETVPVDVSALTNLRVLDLGHNRLSSVPPAAGRLASLDSSTSTTTGSRPCRRWSCRGCGT